LPSSHKYLTFQRNKKELSELKKINNDLFTIKLIIQNSVYTPALP